MNPSNNQYGGPGDAQGRAILGKPFTLSATAPEFVPRNYMPQAQNGMGMNQPPPMYQQQHPSQQMYMQQQMHMQQPPQRHGGPRHNMYSSAPHQRQSYNTGGYQGRHSAPQAPPQQPAMPSTPDPTGQLKQAILILTKDPATFDDMMPELTSNLDSNIHSEEKLIKMVEEIFRQSTEEANFRYTGARVCNYFSHHLSIKFDSGNFKQHLLKRCHDEHKKKETLVKNSDHRYKLCGFTLFMGELLLNLKDFEKANETSEYLRVISKAVQELLQTLLTQPADDTLRCSVQVLKLCGVVLEDAERAQSEAKDAPEVDSIFAILKECVLEKSYIKSLRAQILSVIELRASGWGRSDSSNSSSSSGPPPPAPPSNTAPAQPGPPAPQGGGYNNMPPQQANNPMFYSQDGQGGQPQASGDVDQFANFYPDDLYYYSSGEEDWQNPEEYMYMYNGGDVPVEDEMDPEIAAAFEEFLKNQPNQ